MATHKDSTVELARKYAASGQYAQAIKAWRQLLDDSPNDANIYNTIGDLYLKNKSNTEAVEAYSRAARFFLKDGFHLKAVAVYKKILKIEPNRGDIYALLGDLNAERGLMINAIADYITGAKLYLKDGKTKYAIRLYRKVTDANPSNTSVRLRVAELCFKEREMKEAIAEYLVVAEEYERLQKSNDARELYKKVVEIAPSHSLARQRLGMEPLPGAEDLVLDQDASVSTGSVSLSALDEARRLLESGDVAEAEQMVRTFLLKDPERSEFQSFLGLVYLKKGDPATAYEILHPIARAWAAEGRYDAVLEVANAYLAVEPDHPDFMALRSRAGGLPAESVPSPEAPVDVEVLEGMDDTAASVIEIAVTEEQPAEAGESPKMDVEFEAILREFREGINVQVGDEDFETHYNLGIAYKEMGLIDEAVQELRRAARAPTRFIDACTLIASCYKDQKRNKLAITCLEHALAYSQSEGDAAPYVKYDLAMLYEEEGFGEKAVQLYASIPTIRDAGERLMKIQDAV